MIEVKTKLVATLGPSSSDYDTLVEFAKSGVDLARINLSHGTYKEHEEKIKLITKLRENGVLMGIMLDLKGPKIRCGAFIDGGVSFKKGDKVLIVNEDVLGDKNRFSVSYKNLYKDLNVNDRFSLDDGIMQLKVIEKDEENKTLLVEVLNDHYLKDKKGLNAPYIKLMNEYISDIDKKDIEFACSQPINYIAASFVRRKQDLVEVKELLKKYNREDIKIVSKIESPEGVNNIDEILELSNAIMVARGDLGVELDLCDVPKIQKELIKKCHIVGKPSIVATHMLESMIKNPRPTRAEVSDVFNAVLDGADAIMLSGESASGKYPIEAVKTQYNIAKKAEEIIDYEKLANDFYESSNKSLGDAIGISVSKSILMLDIKLVVIVSNNFKAIRKLAKFKFKAPILAITDNINDAIALNGLYYGIEAKYKKDISKDKEKIAIDMAKKCGINKNENIILVDVSEKMGKANCIKIINLE